MDFLGQIDLAEDGKFQARVRQAVVTAAVQIMADRPQNNPQAIAIHAKRAALANRVLLDPTSLQRAWAYMVVSNPAIGPESNDGDVQWTVNSMWNAMAGVIVEPSAA